MIAKIPVSEAKHQTVADRVEIVRTRSSILRDARAGTGADSRVCSRRRIGKGGPSRVRRRGEVHMEMVGCVVRIGGLTRESDESVRRAGGRQGGAIQISGKKGVDRATQWSNWADKTRRLSKKHFGSIESKRLRTEIGRSRGIEDVHAHVIGIGPDTEVRIIEKVRAEMEPITIISASGIRGLRD